MPNAVSRFGAFLLGVIWLLLAGPVALAVSPEQSDVSSAKTARKAAADRQRRIIFHNDGNDPIQVIIRPSVQDFLAPLDQTTVTLNGVKLRSPNVSGQWLEFRDVADAVYAGDNVVEISLSEKASQKAEWLDLMLQVRGIERQAAE